MMAEGVQDKGGRAEPIFDFLAQTVGWLEGEVTHSTCNKVDINTLFSLICFPSTNTI